MTMIPLLIALLAQVPGLQATGAADAPPIELGVMSFNIRYGDADDGENNWPHRKALVAETIRAHGPAVVGLQECLVYQADYIQAALEGYQWLGIGRDYDGGGEMTAILYRQDEVVPVASGHFWLSEHPEKPGSISWDSSLTRTASWCRFHHPATGRFFLFVNTHFDHRGREARKESAALAAAQARALAGDLPLVFTGDFNARAGESEPYTRFMEAGFQDVWTQAATRVGPATTWSGFEAPKEDRDSRIDWILVRNGVEVLRAETVIKNDDGRYPSDHFPVFARVRMTGKQ